MSTITPIERNDVPAIVPVPRCDVNIRPAVPADIPFIDALQKMHSHMVGWSPTKQIQANIEGGHVLIAENINHGEHREHGEGHSRSGSGSSEPHSPSVSSVPSVVNTPVGYCIARDQYMKRDDVGIVYQLNVLPLKQRHLVGAMLVKAVFDRAAYGCKLFCCWCAQDIQANWFWESIGFVPLAFRTGSRAKQRIHIFWQRRIREGDEGPASGGTPYWFPSQTSGGAVAEDRIVLPIPPDTHWRDAKPVLLPGLPAREPVEELPKLLPGGAPVRPRPEQPPEVKSRAHVAAIARSKSKHLSGVPAGKAAVITRGGVKFVERADAPPEEVEPPKSNARKPRPRKPRQKHDPEYVAAARELRDRYLEQVNTGMLLPPAAHGKYDVSRQLEAAPTRLQTAKLLDAA
jgi:GNAT superfamily N-acetyltransferase